MFYPHTIEDNRDRKITFAVEFDWEPAEPEVGLMSSAFEITAVDVASFGEHVREPVNWNDPNWKRLDKLVLAMVNGCQDTIDEIAATESELAAD